VCSGGGVGGSGGSGVTYQGPCGGGSCGGGGGNSLTNYLLNGGLLFFGNPVYDGGGFGGGSNQDSLTRDSLIKSKLNKDAVAMKDTLAKAWLLGYPAYEYGFWICDDADNPIVQKLITDEQEDVIYLDEPSKKPRCAKLRADVHIHQNSSATQRHMHDPADLVTLQKRANNPVAAQFFTTYVSTNDTLFAIVLEDATKAQAFFRGRSRFMVNENNDAYSRYSSAPYLQRAAALRSYMLSLIGNSAISGLGIYKTNNPEKTNFVKLN
jgi:hypothetical protein